MEDPDIPMVFILGHRIRFEVTTGTLVSIVTRTA